MPVQLEWHPSLPVLVATYSGVLSQDEYQSMNKKRQAMLQAGPRQVILVANTQEMEAFPDSPKVRRGENIVTNDKVYKTLIVFKPDLYRSVMHAIRDTAEFDLPVAFFRDEDAALARAESLSGQLS
jgi:hypothetical protein